MFINQIYELKRPHVNTSIHLTELDLNEVWLSSSIGGLLNLHTTENHF